MRVVQTIEETKELRRAYIASRDGLLKVTKYGDDTRALQFRAVREIDEASSLGEIKPEIIIDKITPIPKGIIDKAVAVFRAVYNKLHTEMAVILCWENGEYRLARPKFAAVSSAFVRHHYKSSSRIGVFHSHPTFTGSPSSTDDDTEVNTPGLYAVFGHVLSNHPDIYMSVAGEGMRVKVTTPDYGDVNPPPLSEEETEWWMEGVIEASALDKTVGWFITDYDRKKKLWWCATEAEAKVLAEDLPIVEAHRPAPIPITDNDDWCYGFNDHLSNFMEMRSDTIAPLFTPKIKRKRKKKDRSSTERKDVLICSTMNQDMEKVAEALFKTLPGDKFIDLLEAMIAEWEAGTSSSDAGASATPLQNLPFDMPL